MILINGGHCILNAKMTNFSNDPFSIIILFDHVEQVLEKAGLQNNPQSKLNNFPLLLFCKNLTKIKFMGVLRLTRHSFTNPPLQFPPF